MIFCTFYFEKKKKRNVLISQQEFMQEKQTEKQKYSKIKLNRTIQ